MKSILLAAAAIALASSANAYVFAPGHETFTLNGTVTVEGAEVCTMNAAGYTHGNAGMITATPSMEN